MPSALEASRKASARMKAIRAKEEIVVEAALAWHATAETGDDPTEAENALDEACADLKRARGRMEL
jgi:hypothetical protein